MENITQNVSLVLLLSIVVKSVLVSIAFPEAILGAFILAYLTFLEFRLNKQQVETITNNNNTKIEEVKLKLKEIEALNEEVKNIKSYISSIKAGSQMRQQNLPQFDPNKSIKF